jgi:calcineurin-like phosphoesterase family protein
MNRQLIKAWNDKVGKGDVIYHLGDLAFTRHKDLKYLRYLKRELNGEIRLLLGNHDDRKACEKVFGPTWMPRGLWRIRHEGENIVICHYSLRTWQGQHHGAWHLYGHSHGSLPAFGKSVDVGVDANFIQRNVPWGTPYSFEEIKVFMNSRHIAVHDNHQVASRR